MKIGSRRVVQAVLAMLVVAGSGGGAAAQASDRWTAHEAEASAALPVAGDVSAALSCAAQRWTLALTAPGAPPPDDGAALLVVDGRPFELAAAQEAGGLSMRLPREALDPLRNGLRMELSFAGSLAEAFGTLAFSLRGSKLAIAAVEERCTLRDMSAFQAVSFTPFSSHLNLARELRAADIKAFELATASQPTVDVAMAELGEGRRILFTRLCGSSWYYGVSGCNVTGFAPLPSDAEGDGEDAPSWRVVYDTESVALHLDPKTTSHGWPDIVTLPARGPGTGLVWRWDGRGYELKGELPPEEEGDAHALGLRPTQE